MSTLERIRVCEKACSGIPTDLLDAGIVADMIMTLREISEGIDINYYGNDFEPSWEAKAASAVLSKLTSGEATE